MHCKKRSSEKIHFSGLNGVMRANRKFEWFRRIGLTRHKNRGLNCEWFARIDSRALRCESPMPLSFWWFSRGFWCSQERLFFRNHTRKPLNLMKSPIFTNTPCKSTCCTMALVCTLLMEEGKGKERSPRPHFQPYQENGPATGQFRPYYGPPAGPPAASLQDPSKFISPQNCPS